MFRNSLSVIALAIVVCSACCGCESNLPKTRIDEEAVTFFDQASLELFAGKWDATIVDTVFESTRNGGDFDFCVAGDHLQFTFEDQNTPVAASGTVDLLLVDNKRYAYVCGNVLSADGRWFPFESFCRYEFGGGTIKFYALAKEVVVRLLAEERESEELQLSELLHAMNAYHDRLFLNLNSYVKLKRK